MLRQITSRGESEPVAIATTLDIKSDEVAYLRSALERRGCPAVLIDCGVLGQPKLHADVSREEVARAAGFDVELLRQSAQRDIAIPASSVPLRQGQEAQHSGAALW